MTGKQEAFGNLSKALKALWDRDDFFGEGLYALMESAKQAMNSLITPAAKMGEEWATLTDREAFAAAAASDMYVPFERLEMLMTASLESNGPALTSGETRELTAENKAFEQYYVNNFYALMLRYMILAKGL